MSVSCPVCGTANRGEACSNCGAALSDLNAIKQTARHLAVKAWELARDGYYTLARERAEHAASLYMDDRLGRLCGWLAFLHGDLTEAKAYWNGELEPLANDSIDAYNRSLEAAQTGRVDAAVELLARTSVPLLPLLKLKVVCAERLGDTSRAQATMAIVDRGFATLIDSGLPRRAHPKKERLVGSFRATVVFRVTVAAIATVLLAIAGYTLVSGRGAGSLPSSTNDPQAGMAPADPTSNIPSRSILEAFLSLDAAQVARTVGSHGLGPAVHERLRPVPEGFRLEAGRRWYLIAAGVVDTLLGTATQDERLLAALASVGVGSRQYWVDDALYLFMLELRETDPSRASAVARLILLHHSSSLFNNSTTRSIAEGTGSDNDF